MLDVGLLGFVKVNLEQPCSIQTDPEKKNLFETRISLNYADKVTRHFTRIHKSRTYLIWNLVKLYCTVLYCTVLKNISPFSPDLKYVNLSMYDKNIFKINWHNRVKF